MLTALAALCGFVGAIAVGCVLRAFAVAAQVRPQLPAVAASPPVRSSAPDACTCPMCRAIVVSLIAVRAGAAPAIATEVELLSEDGMSGLAVVVTTDGVLRQVIRPAVVTRFPECAWAREGGRG